MLARLLSGCVPVAHDSAGAIFIDRDGDLFRHVLAFLRDGPRAALPADADTLRALAVDADYYQLDGLKEAVNERLPEEGSLSPATARARARRAGPDGVLDAALAADGGRMLTALELLAGLAFAPGADSFGGGGAPPKKSTATCPATASATSAAPAALMRLSSKGRRRAPRGRPRSIGSSSPRSTRRPSLQTSKLKLSYLDE